MECWEKLKIVLAKIKFTISIKETEISPEARAKIIVVRASRKF